MPILREVWKPREVPVQLCNQTMQRLPIALNFEKIPHSENGFGVQHLREPHRRICTYFEVGAQET